MFASSVTTILTSLAVNGQTLPFQIGCQTHDQCAQLSVTPMCYVTSVGNACVPCEFCQQCIDGVDRTCGSQCKPINDVINADSCNPNWMTFPVEVIVDITEQGVNSGNPFASTDPVEHYKNILQSITTKVMNAVEDSVRDTVNECQLQSTNGSENVAQIVIGEVSNNADAAYKALTHGIMFVQFELKADIKIFSNNGYCIEKLFDHFHEWISGNGREIESFVAYINVLEITEQEDMKSASIEMDYLEDVQMAGFANGQVLEAPPLPDIPTSPGAASPTVESVGGVKDSGKVKHVPLSWLLLLCIMACL